MIAFSDGGTSGSGYVFNIGDVLEYNFYVDENSSSIIFSIAQGKKKIAEIWGRNGSGQAYVPTTCQYYVTASPLRHILQSALGNSRKNAFDSKAYFAMGILRPISRFRSLINQNVVEAVDEERHRIRQTINRLNKA